MFILSIHIRTFFDKQFSDFLVTVLSRKMQRIPSIIIPRIHIHTSSQVSFDGFDVSFSDCFA